MPHTATKTHNKRKFIIGCPQEPCEQQSPCLPGSVCLMRPLNRNPVGLTNTIHLWFKLTNPASAQEPQSTPVTDYNKGMRPRPFLSLSALYLDLLMRPSRCASFFVSRTCESSTSLFQSLLWSVVELRVTIQHPVFHLTNVNLTQS